MPIPTINIEAPKVVACAKCAELAKAIAARAKSIEEITGKLEIEPAVTAFMFAVAGDTASLIQPHAVVLLNILGLCAKHDIAPYALTQSISRARCNDSGKQCTAGSGHAQCGRTAVTEFVCEVAGSTAGGSAIKCALSVYLCKEDDIDPYALQQQVNRLPMKKLVEAGMLGGTA